MIIALFDIQRLVVVRDEHADCIRQQKPEVVNSNEQA